MSIVLDHRILLKVTFDSMLADLRYAVRSLRRSPGFVAVAVLSLGLALALTTTTYGILDAVRHPYLPVKDPERVFVVGMWRDRDRASAFEMYRTLRDGARFYEQIAVQSFSRTPVRVSDSLELTYAIRVSPNLYQLLGFEAEIGRLFTAHAPPSAYQNAAVVSYDLWATQLGARTLQGLTLTVEGRIYEVIGVLPPGVEYPWGDVFLALPPEAETSGRELQYPSPVVRLKRGVSLEQAEAELAVLAARLNAEYGFARDPFAYRLRQLAPWNRRFRPIHFAMGGAAAAVLLIACANLASLMLARGLVKRRELALRLALGAGRRALVRQLLSESLILALLGGALGVMVSIWAIDLVAHHMPPSVREVGLVVPYLSWRVFAFGFAATAFTVLVFGLLPAVRASDVSLNEPLKDSTGTTTGKVRFRYSPLVVAQVALCLVLLMGAALLSKAAVHVANYRFGFDTKGLLLARLDLPPSMASPDSAHPLVHRVLEHIRSREGVQAAAGYFSVLPDDYKVISDAFDGESGFLWSNGERVVGPDYLRTLGIPVIQGRDFLPGDERTGAVIVEEGAVPQLWPGGNVIGRMVKLGDIESDVPWFRVVGVARNSSQGFKWDPDLPSPFGVYVTSQRYSSGRYSIAIRVRGSEASQALQLQKEIQAVLPPRRALGGWVSSWNEGWEQRLGARYFLVGVFTGFGAFALGLAAFGLYGILSYTVSQRMREFAVRIALGAEDKRVLSLVAHDAAVMVLAGTGIGAFAAMLSAQVLDAWLYDVFFTDAPSLVLAELVLLVTGVAASVQPALRAARANPIEILRAT